MSWTNFFDAIFLVNLAKREDRLLSFTEDAERYGIPFTRIEAIEDERGARGLRDTMQGIFEEAVRQKWENILVFEDDADFPVSPEDFNHTMNEVVKQLPPNYHLCFLGAQLTVPPSFFFSPNLLCGQKMFSTHAVAYSLQGVKEILTVGLDFPIDNFYVDKIQPMGLSYCVYPLLSSQRAGWSDIGQNNISWKPFIDQRYDQQVAKIIK